MSRVYEDHGVEGINLKQVTELSFDIYSHQYLSVYNQFHQSYAYCFLERGHSMVQYHMIWQFGYRLLLGQTTATA